MAAFGHVWFDVEGTLTVRTREYKEAHDALLVSTFAEVTGRPASAELRIELEQLKHRYGSNSAIFKAYGQDGGFWAERFNALDQAKYYAPNSEVTSTVRAIGEVFPISLFTNVTHMNLVKTLRLIGLDAQWFTYILTGEDVAERKPAPAGFRLMVTKSKLPPHEILYVGDRVDVDVRPAKAVGMKTCLVWGHTDEADYSFPDFAGLRTLVTV